MFFFNIAFEKQLPEYGHNRWPKYVGGLRRLSCNKFTYVHMQFLVYSYGMNCIHVMTLTSQKHHCAACK